MMNIFVFTGGVAPEPSKLQSFFEKIQTIDYIIACDSGLDTLLLYKSFFHDRIDFYPSIILGDMDSVSKKDLCDSFCDSKIIKYPHYKDFTDTELGLMKALEIKKANVNSQIILIGGDGGRVDHLLGIVDTFNNEYRPDYWFCVENVICCITEKQKSIIKNINITDRISFINPCPQKECELNTYGLEWNETLFKKGLVMSLSNCISKECLEEKKSIEISVKSGICLVILPFGVIINKEI